MDLKSNLEGSTIILTGTIIPEKMEMLEGILENNFKIYSQFDNIVVVLNTIDKDGEIYLERYLECLHELEHTEKYKGRVYFIRDYINRGWQFGTIDMERTAYQFVKDNLFVGPVLKLDFDIYIEEKILDVNIDDADVMIMPSIGYATTHEEYKGDIDDLMELYDTIHPQSTLYLILRPMDYLYTDSNWLNMKYKEWILNPVGNGPHHIGVACEPLLRESFERNSFTIKSMISKESFRSLLETIETKIIVDPSHKNIFFKEVGVCHLLDNKIEAIIV